MKVGDRVEVIDDRGNRAKRTLIGRIGVVSAGPFGPHATDEHGPTCEVEFDEFVPPFGRRWDFPISFLRLVGGEVAP